MTPTLSVIIPAFNEAARLPDTLKKVTHYLEGSSWADPEVIVVDDGSSDKTAAAAEAIGSQFAYLRVLRNGNNRGKGFSVRRGMIEARGDWRLFTDADLSTAIEEVDRLYLAAGKEYEIAIGSRALDRSLIEVRQPFMRETAGVVFNIFMQAVSGLRLSDTQCGFKLFRSDAAELVFSQQTINGFGFDVEALYIAKLCGLGIAEVPVRWRNAEGSKVTLRNGVQPFLNLLEIRMKDWRGCYKTRC